ncbi:MAG: NapH/MauN family ferredoxin-type protein, partial [Gammaproteobacteria bacterium]
MKQYFGHLKRSISELLGNDPVKPSKDEIAPDALKLHIVQRSDKERIKAIHAEMAEKHANPKMEKFRLKRWAVLIFVNLLFVVSYVLDIQILEGALPASRFVGFHMADLNSSMQVMLAFKHVVLNLVIGTVTLLIIWWFLGGRTFCSWLCPYHLLSEWAEILHLKLAKKKLARDNPFDRRARTWFWVIFVVLAFVSGYTVYETISPTGIVSRALIYGPGLALLWVALLLLVEIFYSRRAWCRYG